MNILFIGTVQFSADTLRLLIELEASICGVVAKETSSFNTDFMDLGQIAEEHGIPYIYNSNPNSGDAFDWIRMRNPDVIFCFGWSSLIKKNLLDLPPLGVVGFHPAKLPKNRGRHPLIWALALGLEETATSFFFMDEGADSGDILSQQTIPIAYEDTASTLYAKVTVAALNQIREFLPTLQAGQFIRTPQDHSVANIWRKRSKPDGKIDFRMSSTSIYNLVRALSRPYVGAHTIYHGQENIIWRAREDFTATATQNIEPGKILGYSGSKILVKCGEGAIWLSEHDFKVLPETGAYFS